MQMKSKLVLLLLMILCTHGFSQLEKGRKLISSSASYLTNTINSSNFTNGNGSQKQVDKNFNLFLKLGYLVRENIMWGGYLNGQYLNTINEVKDKSNSNSVQVTSQKTNTHLLGTFLRLYRFPLKNVLAVYMEFSGDGGYQNQRLTSYKGLSGVPPPTSNPNTTKGTLLNFQVSTGLVYWLSKKWGIEASSTNFGLTYKNLNSYSGSSKIRNISSLNSNSNFSLSALSLGVNYYY
jgi:hypothetical protein